MPAEDGTDYRTAGEWVKGIGGGLKWVALRLHTSPHLLKLAPWRGCAQK